MYVSATAPTLHPNAQDVTSVAGATPARQWADAVEQARQLVRAALAEQNLPGVSVAVGAGSELVWAEGFGWANLENKVPVSPETRFRIGTASTALTSAAVGLLLEKDRLKLDEKIQTYVPEFTEQQWPATLRQVMGHVAGVRNDGGDEGPLFGQRCDRPVDALQHFDSALRFEPGTEYRYSNFGWILVSAAVEAVADKPFLSFMRGQIFEPLGMDHTERRSRDRAEPGSGDVLLSEVRGGSSLRPGPDAPDRSFLLRGIERLPVDPVRPGALRAGDQQRQAAATGDGHNFFRHHSGCPRAQETGYGLGWDIETVTLAGEQTRWVGHDGMVLGGMVASLMTFPEHGLVVSVTSNTSYADTESLALKIAQAFAEP